MGSGWLADRHASVTLDVKGLVCPYPAFETAKILSAASIEEVIEILTDDQYVALKSLPTVLKLRGFDYVVMQLGHEENNFLIKAKRQKL